LTEIRRNFGSDHEFRRSVSPGTRRVGFAKTEKDFGGAADGVSGLGSGPNF
jgi:hypothetical protein